MKSLAEMYKQKVEEYGCGLIPENFSELPKIEFTRQKFQFFVDNRLHESMAVKLEELEMIIHDT